MTMTAQQYRAAVSEAQFQRAVVDLARIHGWRRRHNPDSRKEDGEPGFPDWIFLRGPRLLIVELKKEDGKFRKGQPEWLDAFREIPSPFVEVHVWRPSDMQSGRIARALR
jgi:hypothetical protein